tara:strand:+ start:1047 stop:1526 length:480 start_codon:yes stop_codon:yes gene_type:complete
MGITTFICKIDSVEDFSKAVKAVISHNVSPMEWDGTSYYTDEEFEKLDPRRYKWLKTIEQQLGVKGAGVNGCQQKWTRGENIKLTCFVRHSGKIWLECSNGGGGACSTVWLQSNFPELGWLGTNGKPDGFYESPMVASGQTPHELATQLVSILPQVDCM